jgi:DNA-directed RNA polymerase specialized sigma24 family protein
MFRGPGSTWRVNLLIVGPQILLVQRKNRQHPGRMRDEDVSRLRERAMLVARLRGFPEDAEDFAQQALAWMLEKPDRGATIDQLFVDYLRDRWGDSRTKLRAERCELRRGATPLNDDLISTRETPEDGLLSLTWDLTERERVIVVLRLKWGFEIQEIAECLGIRATTLSPQVQRLMQKIRRVEARTSGTPTAQAKTSPRAGSRHYSVRM